MLRYLGSALCLSLLAASSAAVHAQGLGNEYVCPAGNPCIKAATHIKNVPWIDGDRVEMGWYDLGNRVRRLGFCSAGQRVFAKDESDNYVTVNSEGEIGVDVSLCGDSRNEILHTFHPTGIPGRPDYPVNCEHVGN
jgi:hypothetical protein